MKPYLLHKRELLVHRRSVDFTEDCLHLTFPWRDSRSTPDFQYHIPIKPFAYFAENSRKASVDAKQ